MNNINHPIPISAHISCGELNFLIENQTTINCGLVNKNKDNKEIINFVDVEFRHFINYKKFIKGDEIIDDLQQGFLVKFKSINEYKKYKKYTKNIELNKFDEYGLLINRKLAKKALHILYNNCLTVKYETWNDTYIKGYMISNTKKKYFI